MICLNCGLHPSVPQYEVLCQKCINAFPKSPFMPSIEEVASTLKLLKPVIRQSPNK